MCYLKYNIEIIFCNNIDSYYFEFEEFYLYRKSETDLMQIVHHRLGSMGRISLNGRWHYVIYLDLDILDCREMFHYCLNTYSDRLHVYAGSDLNFEVACQQPFENYLNYGYI